MRGGDHKRGELFNNTIQIPTSLSGFSEGVDSPVKQKKGGLFGILEKLSQLQLVGNQAFAEPYIPKTEHEVLQQFGIKPDIEFGGAGGLNFVSGLSVTNNEGKKINVNDLAFEFLHKEALVKSTEFRRRSYAAIELEKIQKKRVNEIAKFGVSSMIGTDLLLKGDRSGFDPARGDFLIPDEVEKEETKTIVDSSLSDFKFGIDIATREGIDPKSTRGKVLNKTGRDIGTIGRFVDVNEGIRLANLQTTMAGFSNTKGGKAGLAIAAVGGNATQAWQVPRGSVRASADFYARNRMRDSNTNRLNLMGATRVEGIPMDEEGAVVGGYSSRREYARVQQSNYYAMVNQGRRMLPFFGQGMQARSSKSFMRNEYGRMISDWASIQSTLSSAGLGYKTTNARWTRGAGPAHFQYVQAEWAKVRSYNANQLNKASEINILQQGFGLSGYSGSTMSLPSLQDAVAKQDELVKSIGLNRTEAFQIIDTTGRGRDEIDARVLWKNRVNNISTGTSVL